MLGEVQDSFPQVNIAVEQFLVAVTMRKITEKVIAGTTTKEAKDGAVFMVEKASKITIQREHRETGMLGAKTGRGKQSVSVEPQKMRGRRCLAAGGVLGESLIS